MGFEAILEYIFIASYYRQLSADIKIKNFEAILENMIFLAAIQEKWLVVFLKANLS